MEEVKGSNVETEKDGVISPLSDGNSGSADCKPGSNEGRMTGPTRRSSKGGWTEEEDKILAVAVQKFNGKNWKKIAECLSDRTDVQCLHRWQKVLNPDLVKGPWTKEEDDIIIEMVGKKGNKKWSKIAKYLPGRIGKQCRERWHNHLNPEINKNAWTKEEELALIQAHRIYGNKWAELAKYLHGRTENSIKNHWNCSLKKKLCQYSASSDAALSHPGSSIPDSYSYETDAGNRKYEVVKHELGRTFTLDQNMDSAISAHSCFPNLLLGNAKERKNRLQPPFESCRLTGEQLQDGTNKVETSGDPHHIVANKYVSPCEMVLPVTAKNLELSKGAHGNISSMNCLGMGHSSFSGQSNNSHSLRPIYGANEKSNDPKTPLSSADNFFGGLCYEPLQEEDLNILLVTGKFPSTDSYIRLPLSPVSLYIPTSHEKGMSVDYSSPESILRSAAMSFKSMPSIIGKRRLQTSRQVGNVNHSDCACTIEENTDTLNNRQQSIHECPCVKDDLNSVVLPNAKQPFHSPPKSQKLESSAAIKSVEKRLEFASDGVQDSTNIELNISAEGDL
ncbi:transcription factor MYB3R-2-like [Cornus florida]|uniref:transcription factor MYB3R-2-like n=1 Tax=Cornus florida TaxID=4283 RepID=UPI00289BEB85|nr:transcription factor MYB3R-2-like [Cornus florida]